MKNPKASLLILSTCILLAFTIGIFLGRNFGGAEISLSFPEQMQQPPTTEPQEAAAYSGAVLDINTASYEDLLTLPGIGEGLALEIISYRAAKGGFSYVEELMNVPGIGEGRVEAILDRITVGGNP